MIKILTVAEAQKSILRRDMALEPHVPSALQASLDRLFGHGATPETAVAHILRDVRVNAVLVYKYSIFSLCLNSSLAIF
ncbi:MAG: hypothetical protein R6X34_17540, partial [Chloroflexota bacterium]